MSTHHQRHNKHASGPYEIPFHPGSIFIVYGRYANIVRSKLIALWGDYRPDFKFAPIDYLPDALSNAVNLLVPVDEQFLKTVGKPHTKIFCPSPSEVLLIYAAGEPIKIKLPKVGGVDA